MTNMHIEQLNALIPNWGAWSDGKVLAELLDRLRWRPIAEMREEHGECVVININDPGHMMLSAVTDSVHAELALGYGWTHYQRISLGAGEAELLMAEPEK